MLTHHLFICHIILLFATSHIFWWVTLRKSSYHSSLASMHRTYSFTSPPLFYPLKTHLSIHLISSTVILSPIKNWHNCAHYFTPPPLLEYHNCARKKKEDKLNEAHPSGVPVSISDLLVLRLYSPATSQHKLNWDFVFFRGSKQQLLLHASQIGLVCCSLMQFISEFSLNLSIMYYIY